MDNNYDGQIPVFYYDVLNAQARSCYMLIKILKIIIKIEEINFVYYDNLSDSSRWVGLRDLLLKFCFFSLISKTFCQINNFYTSPTLVENGGVTLCHAQTIMIYLCEKYCSPMLKNLYPRDFIARLRIISVFFYNDNYLQKYLNHILVNRFRNIRNSKAIKFNLYLQADLFLCKYEKFNGNYHGRKVGKAYNKLNGFLKSHTYITSNYVSPSIALPMCLNCYLSYGFH